MRKTMRAKCYSFLATTGSQCWNIIVGPLYCQRANGQPTEQNDTIPTFGILANYLK